MNLSIHSSFLPHHDPDASVAFYRDVLGFEVRLDVGQGAMRWVTVGPVDQPDTAIVLSPPTVAPGLTDAEKDTIVELMAKGSYFGVNLASTTLDEDFARLAEAGAQIVQPPTDQPYGLRDGAVRDPSGNLIRIQQIS